MKDFWENYEKFRDLAGLRDADVCRNGRISKSTLSNSRRKRMVPQLDTAYKISLALNISLETLISGEEKDYDFILKRIKFDDDFRNVVYKLARLKEKEYNRAHGMIETYFFDTLDNTQRESTVG